MPTATLDTKRRSRVDAPGDRGGGVEARRYAVAGTPWHVEALLCRGVTAAFAPHAHAEYAIGVALAGRMRLTVTGHSWVVEPGDVIVLPPERVHAVQPCDAVVRSYGVFYVPPGLLEQGNGHWAPRGGGVVLRDGLASAWLCDALVCAFGRHTSVTGERLVASLAQFASRFLERQPRVTPGSSAPLVRAVLERLAAHQGRAPALRPIAASLDMSVFQLIRRFRAATGFAPMAYRALLRARRARALLVQRRTVSEVAVSCGYSDESHLNRQFKRYFGICPGEYARALKASAPEGGTPGCVR